MFWPKRSLLDHCPESEDAIKGQKNFQRHPLALTTGQVSQQVRRDPRQRAQTVFCVGFCVLRCVSVLEGEVHAHMSWHSHSNPLPSHSCPTNAN